MENSESSLNSPAPVATDSTSTHQDSSPPPPPSTLRELSPLPPVFDGDNFVGLQNEVEFDDETFSPIETTTVIVTVPSSDTDDDDENTTTLPLTPIHRRHFTTTDPVPVSSFDDQLQEDAATILSSDNKRVHDDIIDDDYVSEDDFDRHEKRQKTPENPEAQKRQKAQEKPKAQKRQKTAHVKPKPSAAGPKLPSPFATRLTSSFLDKYVDYNNHHGILVPELLPSYEPKINRDPPTRSSLTQGQHYMDVKEGYTIIKSKPSSMYRKG